MSVVLFFPSTNDGLFSPPEATTSGQRRHSAESEGANLSLSLSSRPRWVVPVLPKGELEVLLEAAIDLSKKGGGMQSVSSFYFGLLRWFTTLTSSLWR